ncbi:MAG: DUF6048 family protein [[Clostridium] fimetarium]|nr:DUF6048 family protein [Alistipes timonensis]MCM1405458.1 DUF6048 family protein [[Clostridium] fimetarium]
MRRLRILPLAMLLAGLASLLGLSAQRRVTPVTAASQGITGVNENKLPGDSLDRSSLVEITDENGRKILVDTINGREVPDSLMMFPDSVKIPKMIQPLIYSATVGVNIWDPFMRLIGQKYGLVDFSAEFNLHNRYIAVLEAGVGNARYTPDDNNYTYRVGVTPYFRIGANYNFLYNSNPDYSVYAGLRYGVSHFKYQLTDVTIDLPYWGETAMVDFPSQRSTVHHIQVLFGLRVKVFKQLSLGWEIRYRGILGQTKQPAGNPWYIPGYGTSNGHLGAAFSIYYTFPLGKEGYVGNKADAVPEN